MIAMSKKIDQIKLKLQKSFFRYCLKALGPKPIKIIHSPLARKMTKGALWSLIGALLSRGLTVFASIIIARILGTNLYGEFVVIQSTIGMFAGLGLGMTATKFNDVLIANHLKNKCQQLYIIVTFKEQEPLASEHINIY